MIRERADVVIVGAGFAGAATAFFLSRERRLRIVWLEQESHPGLHSSGRNASLISRTSTDARVATWAREGADFVASPPSDFDGDPGFRRTGSFFVGHGAAIRERQVAGTERVPLDQVLKHVPHYRAAPGCEALFTPEDGVVNTGAYLDGLVRSAVNRGVQFHRGVRGQRLILSDGAVSGVTTESGHWDTSVVVDAAGAWAGTLATEAGLDGPRLRPTRRHILVTEAVSGLSADAPYVWDLVRGFYFRPENGGLLLCACDEVDDRAGPCVADPAMERHVRDLAAVCLPDWTIPATRRFWAGHRTFGSGQGFLLGPSSCSPGLVFAAGLGGHGLTTAAAVGRIVAQAVLEDHAAHA